MIRIEKAMDNIFSSKSLIIVHEQKIGFFNSLFQQYLNIYENEIITVTQNNLTSILQDILLYKDSFSKLIIVNELTIQLDKKMNHKMHLLEKAFKKIIYFDIGPLNITSLEEKNIQLAIYEDPKIIIQRNIYIAEKI